MKPWEGHPEAVLTVKDVAAWLQVDPKTVRRLDIPFVQLGMGAKHITRRYVAADVATWIAAHKRAA